MSFRDVHWAHECMVDIIARRILKFKHIHPYCRREKTLEDMSNQEGMVTDGSEDDSVVYRKKLTFLAIFHDFIFLKLVRCVGE